ncbi:MULTISPECIES: ATP-dependent sacrificial sulfur transferase LarE [unclassified Rhodococcus (in: high G+C Gram-positive bacteria)]|uniref:ATP-dependent sacrificial sulfur transferase LarE n=1 Tax=unclassified Rhodococcus (in: high G+C Gram-positive bacteria) TaxID=192944 RepID=UPI0027DF054E|nr:MULTISPECIES: ATP-dependent sacrificial sulfur transferase LarE [unclassified Rhodococcus (in: high G+C Gram-positive bacteria)]
MTVSDAAERLTARLAGEEKLLVAFSGGADSALLATAAHRVLGDRAVAVTAVSASLPSAERAAARRFAREQGIAHVEVCTDELDDPEYVANTGNRCFHCKSALFDALTPLATLMGARMALGTNLDDLGDHRPGQTAAAQRGAIAPMVDAELTKADVRAISAEWGLVTADKPAAACLSSRIAYGDRVTAEVLGKIEHAEQALHDLGFRELRVRTHADGTLARVEVAERDMAAAFDSRDDILRILDRAGFVFGSLDLRGLRSGSMNALLSLTPVVR